MQNLKKLFCIGSCCRLQLEMHRQHLYKYIKGILCTAWKRKWIGAMKGNKKGPMSVFSSSVAAQLDRFYLIRLDSSFTHFFNGVASIWFHIDKILFSIRQVLSEFDIKCSKIFKVGREWDHHIYWSKFKFAFVFLFDCRLLLLGSIIISVKSRILLCDLLFKFWMNVSAFCSSMVSFAKVDVVKYFQYDQIFICHGFESYPRGFRFF